MVLPCPDRSGLWLGFGLLHESGFGAYLGRARDAASEGQLRRRQNVMLEFLLEVGPAVSKARLAPGTSRHESLMKDTEPIGEVT